MRWLSFVLLFVMGCADDPPAVSPSAPLVAREGAVALVGDSRVSLDPIQTLCDRPVLNLGVPGIQTPAVLASLPLADLIAHPPAVFILAVGVNDTWYGAQTPLETWNDAMRDLHTALANIAPVLVVTIIPTEPLPPYGWSFDHPRILSMNAWLRIQPWHILDLVPLIPPTWVTVDGVHFTSSFYQTVHEAYDTACVSFMQRFQ